MTIADGIKGAKVRKIAKKNNRDSSWFYLGIAGQIGYTIAIPLVLGTVVGKAAGNALAGLSIGFVISIVGFIRIIKNLL